MKKILWILLLACGQNTLAQSQVQHYIFFNIDRLFALSEGEYDQIESPLIRKDKLRNRLIYGNYPELLQLSTKEEKNRYLNDLVSS